MDCTQTQWHGILEGEGGGGHCTHLFKRLFNLLGCQVFSMEICHQTRPLHNGKGEQCEQYRYADDHVFSIVNLVPMLPQTDLKLDLTINC